MKYLLGGVSVLVVLATLMCCARSAPVESESVAVLPLPVLSGPSSKEIADRVEQVYRECVCLCVHAEIRQEPIDGDYTRKIKGGTDLITVDSVFVKDSFLTRVFDALGDPIREFRLKKGKIRESTFLIDAETGEMDPKGVEYEPRVSHGIDNPKLTTEIDCMIGAHTFSWVGVTPNRSLPPELKFPEVMDRAQSMRIKIEGGVREPDAFERNIDCYVFRQTIRVGEDTIEHVVYIEKEDYDVRRWDTIQSGVHRKRIYGVLRFEVLPLSIPFLREGDEDEAAGKV